MKMLYLKFQQNLTINEDFENRTIHDEFEFFDGGWCYGTQRKKVSPG